MRIVSLGIADADLDDAELAPILEQCVKSKTLKVLDVAGNGLGGANDTNGASALSVMRSSNLSVRRSPMIRKHTTLLEVLGIPRGGPSRSGVFWTRGPSSRRRSPSPRSWVVSPSGWNY